MIAPRIPNYEFYRKNEPEKYYGEGLFEIDRKNHKTIQELIKNSNIFISTDINEKRYAFKIDIKDDIIKYYEDKSELFFGLYLDLYILKYKYFNSVSDIEKNNDYYSFSCQLSFELDPKKGEYKFISKLNYLEITCNGFTIYEIRGGYLDELFDNFHNKIKNIVDQNNLDNDDRNACLLTTI